MGDRYDLVVVGMGSGGLVAAEFASTLGLRIAIIERARVGGDCLWTGCVPSKALIASANAAQTMRDADRFGIEPVEPTIDLAAVWRRLRQVRDDIANTDDDPDRYRAMGIEVIEGHASLSSRTEVSVAPADGSGVRQLTTRYVLLCTGGRPAEPHVPGMAEAGFLTSENLFDVIEPPRSIVFIGGGPIGVELAQASARLGVRATILQRGPTILPRDEPSLVAIVATRLAADGVDVRTGAEAHAVEVVGDRKAVHANVDGHGHVFATEEIVVAAGRRPNVEGLGLDDVGIRHGASGVVVDERGRTTVKNVYAAGDVTGRPRFTHAAGYQAVRAVRDMFFPGAGRADAMVPWCTFTDPELAHAGSTSAEAIARHGASKVEVWRHELAHSDRARTDATTSGAIVIVTAKGRIVGAHICAPHAGELIGELALAIVKGLKLSEVAELVHVYPTLSTGIGQLAATAAYRSAQRYRWLIR
jgi:pyruvate/2-oxoglutarate dehydrogenase complex dihydrolipoamide dehydrogenase (E3) component